MKIIKVCVLSVLVLLVFNIQGQGITQITNSVRTIDNLTVGADRTEIYLPVLKGKSVAIVANQSSNIKRTHLVDSLLSLGVKIKKVFCPEHGFRGMVNAGEKVSTEKDVKTGLTIVSLYGKHKKPTASDLKGIDLVIFDIQDVGVRFYTYLSTLHNVMEACAENKKTLIVFDRPNPNGFYIDGPVLEEKYKSFLGMHPVPIVYGMTIGEYAKMINGEGWLKNQVKCDLQIITIADYTHNDFYELPVRPSPNLPNMASVYLYPSLGLFEGTVVAVGRGTNLPFQVIGHPTLKNTNYTFTPKPNQVVLAPKYQDQVCYGFNLSQFGEQYMSQMKKIYLYWLIGTYNNTPDKATFFDENFNYHAGNSTLQQQIKDGVTEDVIRKSWQADIEKFKLVREKYLLYKDFDIPTK